MSLADRLQLRFWGVRGSIPTPQAENLGYGGNTPCLEVRYGAMPPLILDAGSGARPLGNALLREFPGGVKAGILFTHFHWDHIQGLPFFAPLYEGQAELSFYSAREPRALEAIIGDQMRAPYFPVTIPGAHARSAFSAIPPGGLRWGDLRVHAFPLCHPDGGTGYRIESPRGALVYASDHEHGDARHDEVVREHAAGADILVYDAQYTPEEYEDHRGWGHSTWRAGVRAAAGAGVHRLVLFHHDPEHDDAAVGRIAADAASEFGGASAAREGSCLEF